MAYAWGRKNKRNGLAYNILRFGDPEEELEEFWQFQSPGKDRWPRRTLRLPFGKKQMWEAAGNGPLVHLMMLADARMEERWKEEFPDVWAQDETDCGRVAGEVEVSGTQVPFKQQPRLPAEMEEVAARLLRKLERGGVVVRGTSPSNSPFKLSKKQDGKTWRLTLDCKAIDRATPVVVPRVALDRTKLVTTLSPQSKCFSVLDLSNAAFAIPLAAGSRARFAFTFWGQQYLFTRLPQGFHSTPSILHRRVDEMLAQLDQGDRAWVLSFVDDILIAGRNERETETRTRKVLKLIQNTGFKVKYEKAQLVQPNVIYLGMAIGPKGRGIPHSRVEAIRKAPSPRDIHKLRSLLGQFANLQDHIHDYWELARPLQRLTLQHVPWKWGTEQEQALSRLKHAIQAAPTLRFPEKSQPFAIRLTTNKETVAATLLQEDEGKRLVPVGHHSRMLKEREVSCPPPEKGSLAAVWAVQVFKTLTGSAPICIQMPHSPWKCLLWGEGLGSSGTNLQPVRWTLRLVNGGGTARGPQAERGLVPTAPPLRLLPVHVPTANVWFVATKKASSMGFAAVNLEERWLLGAAVGHSALGMELLAVRELMHRHRSPAPLYVYTNHWALVKSLRSHIRNWELWPTYGEGLWPSICQWVCAESGRLHIRWVGGNGSEDAEGREWCHKAGRRAGEMADRAGGTQWVWEPSKHEKQEIIAQCHGCWHEWVEGTLARVRRVARWHGDSRQVSLWVQSCLQCAAGRGATGRGATGRVPPQRAEGPWSELHLDCVSGLPEGAGGLRTLLVLEDKFSGWLEAFPLREKTAAAVVEVLGQEVWARYGTPGAIHLPRVPRFLRDAVLEVMPECNVWPAWHMVEAGKPGPGAAVLQRLAQAAGTEWVRMLPLLLAAARAMRVQLEEMGPYQITCGFPVEMWWGCERVADGNVLAWLRQLEEDGTGYRDRLEAALQQGLPRERS